MSCKDQQRSSKPKASIRSSSSMAYGDAQPKVFKASRKSPGHPKPKAASDSTNEGASSKRELFGGWWCLSDPNSKAKLVGDQPNVWGSFVGSRIESPKVVCFEYSDTWEGGDESEDRNKGEGRNPVTTTIQPRYTSTWSYRPPCL